MIIKSHIRGGYRAMAAYLKDQGENEHISLIEISDPDAKNLDQAFHAMWTVASTSKATKPLHHISINPFKDERLTQVQLLKIIEHCEKKYGYKPNDHQRVIVEHIKDGRQHFHVVWNRVSFATGKAVWPGHHWNKSKQAAREMEVELGLKRPMPRQVKRIWANIIQSGRASRYFGRYQTLDLKHALTGLEQPRKSKTSAQTRPPLPFILARRKRTVTYSDQPNRPAPPLNDPQSDIYDLLRWAWENGRTDILAQFGIFVDLEM